MDDRILVTYASKHGSTTEIAERIGEVLREEGLTISIEPVDRVGDLGPYAAVVLGSAVYVGRWRKEAAEFLKNHEEELAGRPVWLFSSGPTGEGDPVQTMDGWQFPENLQDVADRIGPQDTAVFLGAIDPGTLNFLERTAIKKVGAPVGDFRDWYAIANWARSIAATLRKQPTT